jgi:two-component system sensor kinase FixL
MATASPTREAARTALLQPDPDDATTAWWALDISLARASIAAVAAGNAADNWVDVLLAGVEIADVDHNIVHLIGPYGGRDRLLGQPITEWWPSESWPALAALIVACVADHPAGAPRRLNTSSLAFSPGLVEISSRQAHPDIVFISVGGTVTDDRSFWEVRASEDRYRHLMHHLPMALLQVDSTPITHVFERLRREGVTDIVGYLDEHPEMALHARSIIHVTDANHNAERLFAADRARQLFGSVSYLFDASPDTAKRVIAAHFNGVRTYVEVMKLRTFDGRMRDVELSVTYPMPPERLDVTILSIDDITDRLRTEAQLRQLQADFSRAARISMLGELATSIAHEVNQPLSAIVTNAETSLRWLSRDDPNLAKVGQLTGRIVENARRASDIVQRVRGMASQQAPERTPLDLNPVVDEALLFLRHEIESRAIDLSVRLARDLPPVLGDRVQLQQVIVNLLVNGIQAMASSSGRNRLELATRVRADGAVTFCVHDSGPGVPAEYLDRIFDGFFTTKADGIGIGLAICHSIIAAHGGEISVSNHPDGGAVFEFWLPPAQG